MSTLLCSHGGSAKDAEFTTERLRQMKLYSNSRIRYTLHKAVEIAYANANALKASDFGVMDQVFFVVVVLLCFLFHNNQVPKMGHGRDLSWQSNGRKNGSKPLKWHWKIWAVRGGSNQHLFQLAGWTPWGLKEIPFSRGCISFYLFPLHFYVFVMVESRQKLCLFGQEHEIFFWIIDLFLVCIFCCSSVFLG